MTVFYIPGWYQKYRHHRHYRHPFYERNQSDEEECTNSFFIIHIFGAVFCFGYGSDELFSKIEKAMETKVDAIIMHDLFAKYKTAPSDEEREKARLEYLEKRGISESFRW